MIKQTPKKPTLTESEELGEWEVAAKQPHLLSWTLFHQNNLDEEEDLVHLKTEIMAREALMKDLEEILDQEAEDPMKEENRRVKAKKDLEPEGLDQVQVIDDQEEDIKFNFFIILILQLFLQLNLQEKQRQQIHFFHLQQ